jgi:hypothetical protein
LKTQRTYALISVLVAGLIISSSVASYYLVQYDQEVALNATYADQLNKLNSKYDSAASSYNSLVSKYNSATADYQKLATSYNGSVGSFKQVASSYVESVSAFQNLATGYQFLLSNYNRSLYLLIRTVSVMNTSEPAYQNATRALSGLSASYDNLSLRYRLSVQRYDSLVSSFQQTVKQFQASNNVTLIQQYPNQVRPIPTNLLAVNILIEPGDGTRQWHNDTHIQAGWSMYITTLVLVNGSLGATWYPQVGGGEHFINSINGVASTNSKSWFLWTYNGTAHWQVAQAGADLTPAINGSTYAWTYCQYDQSYSPTCAP